jgi:AcrR family transcriptional regulator
MTLGQRCDEIVRLIDEMLSACDAAPGAPRAAPGPLGPRAAAPASGTSRRRVGPGVADAPGGDLAEALPRSA